jgi:hypothetical protein
VLELDAWVVTDSSFGGINNVGRKSGCVEWDAWAVTDSSFGGINNVAPCAVQVDISGLVSNRNF